MAQVAFRQRGFKYADCIAIASRLRAARTAASGDEASEARPRDLACAGAIGR